MAFRPKILRPSDRTTAREVPNIVVKFFFFRFSFSHLLLTTDQRIQRISDFFNDTFFTKTCNCTLVWAGGGEGDTVFDELQFI